MKKFGHCIWLTNSDKNNNHWNQYTNGFQSHITIKYNLDLQNAEQILYSLQKQIENKKIKINLSDELFYSKENEFYCLYKKAFLVDNTIPDWFPLNAHVSFYYSYSPISEAIFESTKKNLENKNTEIFDCMKIKLCDDHFLLW